MHELAYSQYCAIAACFSLCPQWKMECEQLCHQTCTVIIMRNTRLEIRSNYADCCNLLLSVQRRTVSISLIPLIKSWPSSQCCGSLYALVWSTMKDHECEHSTQSTGTVMPMCKMHCISCSSQLWPSTQLCCF